MRRVIAVASVAAILAIAIVSTAGAQPPKGATPDAHSHPASGAAPSTPTAAPAQTPSPGAHGQTPMAMCMEMMRAGGGMMGHHGGTGGSDGGMMRGPMMGMGMSGTPADPKTMSQMMEMRGEMMKAMGDIMMKHAQKMRAAESPSTK